MRRSFLLQVDLVVGFNLSTVCLSQAKPVYVRFIHDLDLTSHSNL